MQLTKNFTSEEFLCPCCDDQDMRFVFVKHLQKMRDIYGKPMIITSGWRCSKYNSQISKSRSSKHMDGMAADIKCSDSHEKYELIKAAYEAGMTGIGGYDHHVHVDLRKTNSVFWIGQSI